MSASPVPSVAEVRMAERPAENRRSLRISPTSTGAEHTLMFLPSGPDRSAQYTCPSSVMSISTFREACASSMRAAMSASSSFTATFSSCFAPSLFNSPINSARGRERMSWDHSGWRMRTILPEPANPRSSRAFWKNRPEASITSCTRWNRAGLFSGFSRPLCVRGLNIRSSS